MADRKASDGAPKASSAKGRASSPRKISKPASPVLPVKAQAKEPAKPAAPVKAVAVKKATKPSAVAPAPVRAEKTAVSAAPVVKAPAPEAVLPTPPAPIEITAAVAPVAAAAEEAVQQTISQIQNIVKEGIEDMDTKTTQTVDATKTAADQAQAMFGDINERAKGVMEKNAKIVQEVTDLTKGNVEAIVASSRAAAKGVESLSREAAEYGRKSFEEASTALKSFAEIRSPADLFRLQSDYARSYFDSVVAESSKLSEAFVKIAGEVAEPITNRYSVAAERVRSIAL